MNYVECETLLTTVISNVIANASKKILYFDFLCAYNNSTEEINGKKVLILTTIMAISGILATRKRIKRFRETMQCTTH